MVYIRYFGMLRSKEFEKGKFIDEIKGEVVILPGTDQGARDYFCLFEVKHDPAPSQVAPPSAPVAPHQQRNQCAKCGQLNESTARFCVKCGSSLQ